ncbi:MAG: MarR family transcriptional regulator [Rhodospirillaceae bacterium]|jgi:DNA-binding MarR family transcriptional regulator|nr:MarR family transcriptional regulator [Rhodospirillaceae bacterium]MBT3885412.1 MarR family transcriptional regulator [Rhodospirillaceae bacterium]MBT4115965.1 MarR family transcriptional regulator [Rhodospirillaceae bacterium]MBT4673325.1 MarR family transcriptional regulator [Rhodospirillaceae bacterium]MBT4748618.1 MarR family transcriptional regulator [Rhodospirillaceae bacterium]
MTDTTHATHSDGTMDRLMRRPGYVFRRCAQSAGGIFERACRDLALTRGQYDVLFVIANEQSIAQDRLAQMLGLDRSTTGVLATNLERKGLIARNIKPSDRRKLTLNLTEAGKIAFETASPAAEQAREQVLATLSPEEQDQLFALLRRIIDAPATPTTE